MQNQIMEEAHYYELVLMSPLRV